MATTDLLCTHDLTAASDAALTKALALAGRMGCRITVLHVTKPGMDEEAIGSVQQQLHERIEQLGGHGSVDLLLSEGHFMDRIAEQSGKGYALAVIGTHGPHGIRQNLFGADILKLVRSMAVPTLVVQEGYDAQDRMTRIVLPVASHHDIDHLLDAVCALALLHNSEVHVFQLMRPNEQASDALLKNKLHMLERLQREGIRHVEANEPSTSYSIGFAGPTADYAKRIAAGCIAIMSHASDEYRHIADAEKERALTNEGLIPVLCA